VYQRQKLYFSMTTKYRLLILCLLLAFDPKCHEHARIFQEAHYIHISYNGMSNEEGSTDYGFYPISPSGEIDLPDVGRFKISGLGFASISLGIRKAYRDLGRFPNLEVVASPWDGCSAEPSPCIDISGDLWVGHNSIPIRFDKLLLSEVLENMRPKDSADLTKIRILRDEKYLIVDATDNEGLNTELKHYDIITVPSLLQGPPFPHQRRKIFNRY
jgi:hypothetical protein